MHSVNYISLLNYGYVITKSLVWSLFQDQYILYSYLRCLRYTVSLPKLLRDVKKTKKQKSEKRKSFSWCNFGFGVPVLISLYLPFKSNLGFGVPVLLFLTLVFGVPVLISLYITFQILPYHIILFQRAEIVRVFHIH